MTDSTAGHTLASKDYLMIDSVKRIATMKAIDLPPTFDLCIGRKHVAMEIDDVDAFYVYLRCEGDIIYVPRNEMLTILVPDTLENAALDIEWAIMNM